MNIKVDKEKTLEELKIAFGKALSFAVEIDYVCKDTIGFLIRKAGAQEQKLKRTITGEPAPEGVPPSSELGGKPVAETAEEKVKEEPRQKDESSTSSKQSNDSSTKADAGSGLASLFG